MTAGPLWLARSLEFPLPDRRLRRADDLFDAARALFRAAGFATAERRLGAPLNAVPVPCVVELREGRQLAVVRRADDGALELELERGTLSVSASAIAERLTGRALVFYPSPRGSLVGALVRLVVRDRTLLQALLDAIGMSVLLRGLSLVLPLLTREALARAIPGAESASLTTVAIAIAATGVFVGVTAFLRARVMRFVEVHVAERFTRELFLAFISKPFDELRSRPYASYIEDFAAADDWVRQSVPQLTALLDGAFALVFLAALAWLSPAVAGLAAAGALLAAVVVILLAGRSEVPLKAMMEARARRQDTLLECVEGIDVVRMEGLERRAAKRFSDAVADGLHAELRLGATRAATEATMQAYERGLFLVVFLLLGWRCLDHQVELADFVAAIQLVTAFEASFRPLLAIPERIASLRVLSTRLEGTLGDLDGPPPAPREHEQSRPTPGSAAPALLLQGVSYRHAPGHPWVLRDFELRVERGAHVTLTWPSGSGKTTLLRLLAGLHAPTSGSILVNDDAPEAAREAVCYIPQDAALLTLSVMGNLRVFSRGASEERIVEVARATGLAEMVEAWPMGWHTAISGGGLSLSSGQRQLLLLTAAAASRCPIVLLDEAFAHLDAQTKRRCLSTRPFEGRTVISVEHEPR